MLSSCPPAPCEYGLGTSTPARAGATSGRACRLVPRGKQPPEQNICADQLQQSALSVTLFRLGEEGLCQHPVREPAEVASLLGDVAEAPSGNLRFTPIWSSESEMTRLWLDQAHVRPTLEIIVTESPAHLRKVQDPESGLALIRPAA